MWKIGLALIVLAACFGGGYYYGSGNVIEKIVKEQGETHTVIQDHVITRTVEKKPDGTTVETTKDETVEKQEETKTSSTVRDTAPGENRPNYTVGASYWVRSSTDALGFGRQLDGYSFSVSRRLVGPLRGDVQARPFGRREVALGLSVEF